MLQRDFALPIDDAHTGFNGLVRNPERISKNCTLFLKIRSVSQSLASIRFHFRSKNDDF